MLNWYFEKRGKMQTQHVFLCDFTRYRKNYGYCKLKAFLCMSE